VGDQEEEDMMREEMGLPPLRDSLTEFLAYKINTGGAEGTDPEDCLDPNPGLVA
jgi:hypothetical protein